MKIQDVKSRLKNVEQVDDPFLMDLTDDPRKGVQRLVQQKMNQIHLKTLMIKNFKQRLIYEEQIWQGGLDNIAGVDEVGRGPLAGPVVTCAVILPKNFALYEVNDSKKLTPVKRAHLYHQILDQSKSVSIGVADNYMIDQDNIYQATRIAMKDAIEHLSIEPDSLLVDAMHIDTMIPQTKLLHGDAKSVSIGAASIVAKVYRDHLMDQYAKVYPEYGFEHNAGYGTKQHLLALDKYGATPIHRQSFAPVRDIINHS